MTEDMDGLPDVDLSSLQDKDPKEEEKNKDPNPETSKPDLAQFKTPEDLLKAYKELQGFDTKVSQENKKLKEDLEQLQEKINLSKPAQTPQQDPNFDSVFMENPQAAIQKQLFTMRVAEILEEEQEKNEPDFQERYSYAQRVIQQYPNMGRTPVGIKRAFKYGDKLRKETLKQSTSKMLEAVFGEPLNDEEIDNLRKIVKKQDKQQSNSNAYMPDTNTSSSKTPNLNRKPELDTKINTSVEQGDVDGVLDGLFQKVLAE